MHFAVLIKVKVFITSFGSSRVFYSIRMTKKLQLTFGWNSSTHLVYGLAINFPGEISIVNQPPELITHPIEALFVIKRRPHRPG